MASETSRLTILTGASRGLGAALARQLLMQPGHLLIGIARTPDAELDAWAARHGSRCLSWAVDLTEAPAAAQLLGGWLRSQPTDAWEEATLINNAALLPRPGPLAESAAAELSDALRVGLEAPMLLTSTFLAETAGWLARRNDALKVLNISSGLGRRAMAGSAAYCAAKAGMDHFTRAVALEEAFQSFPARIASLAPGVIDTDMQVQLRGGDPAAFPEQVKFAQLKSGGLLDSAEVAAGKVLARLARGDFGDQAVVDVRDA